MGRMAVIINGSTHYLTVDRNGNKTYDPPLPPEEVERGKKNMEDIIKSGIVPVARTQDDFHRGRGTLLDQMQGDENWTKHIVQQANKRGYNPSANDVYLAQLADYPGDPKAFIRPTDGMDEVKRRVTKAGKGMEAPFVSIEGDTTDRGPKHKLNPKTTKKFMQSYRQSGQFNDMTDKELKNHVVKTHGKRPD